MKTQKAENQLAEIYAQISKTELYQGFKARPAAITGLSGLVAALVQPYWVEPQQIGAFVDFWVFIAIVNVMFIGSILGYRYLYLENDWERAKTRNMLMQFGPCLFAGALVTSASDFNYNLVAYLPGLWSLILALGILAARPYLSNHLFWNGMYYLAAAMVLFWLAPNGLSLQPWGMGLTFGIGQLLGAAIIYWDVERYETE
ncbi:hypothetical protein QUF50_07370 [Thiotrichales bacterium HSG1]|nr:hypothetical protein [Thiotrichales bacterium HSG1]